MPSSTYGLLVHKAARPERADHAEPPSLLASYMADLNAAEAFLEAAQWKMHPLGREDADAVNLTVALDQIEQISCRLFREGYGRN